MGNSPLNATDPTGQVIFAAPFLIGAFGGFLGTLAGFHLSSAYSHAEDAAALNALPASAWGPDTQAQRDRHMAAIESDLFWGELYGHAAIAVVGAPVSIKAYLWGAAGARALGLGVGGRWVAGSLAVGATDKLAFDTIHWLSGTNQAPWVRYANDPAGEALQLAVLSAVGGVFNGGRDIAKLATQYLGKHNIVNRMLHGSGLLGRGLGGQPTARASGSDSLWQTSFPGVQVRRFGEVWVKRVDPNASGFLQWWGRQTINAQHRALQRLGDMATPNQMRNGRLFLQDVGETFGGGRFSLQMFHPTVVSSYIKGSYRMGTPFNDIIPRNMGRNGLIFDPAIDWFTQSISVGITVGTASGLYYVGDFLRGGE